MAPEDIPISSTQYFRERLLNFNQYFASDADYIFLPDLCMGAPLTLIIKICHVQNKST